jgi:hypothetical protein
MRKFYKDNTACIKCQWDKTIVGGRERAKHINIRKQKGNMLFVNVLTVAQGRIS